MQHFQHDGFDFAYVDRKPERGAAEPVLLIHGFASNHFTNWISPGWMKTLAEAGYRPIAFDNRGHGETSKSYDPAVYTPEKMASDAVALLDHLGIETAHVMGYSMGSRISAFMALAEPQRVATLVFGGLGIGMVDGVGDWDPIATALLAEDPSQTKHGRARSFRAFADQTKSDRRALAACITTSRALLTEDQVARITQPTLIAVGTKDDIAGSGEELAAIMPNAVAFDIEGRDHMLAVGDKTFKTRVLDFLAEHPLI
ncbi:MULTISPECIES: alpha/beta fold hydrolase [Mesorhizobium]|uniref:Alpha/beta hydrolase n=1 Tax=Mesorhizobium denitrificans TaxID=2294114 RepID=A0A371X711_9HYPH|nr:MULTISPECIES: alpha/beta hydrolase [Mesorhizobium]RFC64834.1 alpha/beta hydrolase [Mesorhizobium denitrificans]